MWRLESLEVTGGFLPGLKINFPPGLTCIIGPRGSGKSTLAEFIRYVIRGQADISKARSELLHANLGSTGLIRASTSSADSQSYVITRGYKQQAFITTGDGRQITSIDLERGTFLPLDAYNSQEMEAIADEELGEKRRALLDQLCAQDLQQVLLSMGERKRTLEGNADSIRAQEAKISDITEQIEELGDIRARLTALGPATADPRAAEYAVATKQRQTNIREQQTLQSLLSGVLGAADDLRALIDGFEKHSAVESFDESENTSIIQGLLEDIGAASRTVKQQSQSILQTFDEAAAAIDAAQRKLKVEHDRQLANLATLSEINHAASEAVRERALLEEKAAMLDSLERQKRDTTVELNYLIEARKKSKADYLEGRAHISKLREDVANTLQHEAGNKIRIRVIRNADDMAYRQQLLEALKGARVRNHDDILNALLTLRPEELSQILVANDLENFEEQMHFGAERSGRILESLRFNVDPWKVETVSIDDRILIELNVGTSAEPIFKDAADLSRGQKCTALLPLLLAQRDTPIIIDQPEDNLDNHFIFETIVEAISRLKSERQMILITHNANIPVLADADLILVMNSDGKVGYVERSGTVDECRTEIIDLLEGGRKAFELRASRYGRN